MRLRNFISKRLLPVIRPLFTLSLLLAFTFSLSACFLLPEDEEVLASPVVLKEPVSEKMNTEKVKRANIVKKIKFWGYFMSPVQSDLSFTYMGRLKSINVVQGDAVKAGDVLAKLESDDLDIQLSQLEISLQKAKLNYDKLKTEYEINGGGNKYQLEDAKLNVESVELSIAGVKENLAKVSISSPISGIVSYVNPKELGEFITLKSTFITVCNRKDMVVVAKKSLIKEDIPLGSEVTVTYNGKVYKAKVIKTPEENTNEKNQNFVNAYSIKVEGLDINLINLNDMVSVEFIVQKADNVLIVNKANIKVDNKKSYVYVYKDGAIEEREVVTGIESANGVEVEIKEGLTETDEVIVQ